MHGKDYSQKPRFLNYEELTLGEKILFGRMNKDSKLVDSLRKAMVDLNSGNCHSYNSVEEILDHIKSRAL